jgi:hypothetical protein
MKKDEELLLKIFGNFIGLEWWRTLEKFDIFGCLEMIKKCLAIYYKHDFSSIFVNIVILSNDKIVVFFVTFSHLRALLSLKSLLS